jgi:site-specific recombinase XerD
VAEQARGYVAASRSENTRRAYRADWDHFTSWCGLRGLSSLPADPTAVALYVTDMAGTFKVATISRRMVSIAQAHRAAGHLSPTTDERVRLVNAGIRRVHGTASRQVRPVVTDDLRQMVYRCGADNAGIRDRALLLVGFAAALRRSELVALDAIDAEETNDGVVLTVRRSKTDQEGAGRKIGIPYGSNPATCPVRAWRAWTERADITEGPLFRGIDRHGNIAERRLSDRGVALIVKRRAEAAGIDPYTVSGHSLRAGLATAAAAAGVSERAIAAKTGHKSMTVLRSYIRNGSLFTENAAAAVGL